MPYFSIKLSLPPEIAAMVQFDSSKVLFTLEGRSINFDTTAQAAYDSYFKQITLKPMYVNKRPVDINEKLVSTANRDYYTNNDTVDFEIFCIPKDCLRLNKPNVSGVYSEINMTEAVLALTNKLDTKVYLSPLDNSKKYKQVILVPSNVLINIKHLQDNYGLYNDDLRMFTNGRVLNIGPMHSESYINVGNILVNVNFPINKTQNSQLVLGSYKEIDQTTGFESIITNSKTSEINLTNLNELNAETFGNNNYYLQKSIHGGTSFDFFNEHLTNEDGEFYKTKTFKNYKSNPHALNSLRTKISNSTLVTYSFTNLDISYEDVFKSVEINFDSLNYKDRYSKKYHMTDLTLIFTIDQSGATTQTGRMVLRENAGTKYDSDNIKG